MEISDNVKEFSHLLDNCSFQELLTIIDVLIEKAHGKSVGDVCDPKPTSKEECSSKPTFNDKWKSSISKHQKEYMDILSTVIKSVDEESKKLIKDFKEKKIQFYNNLFRNMIDNYEKEKDNFDEEYDVAQKAIDRKYENIMESARIKHYTR